MVMGRPRFFDDEKDRQLKAVLRLKPTKKDVAFFLDCCEETIENHIREKYDMTFSDFRDKQMTHTRFSIVRKAIQKAEAGDNTMLIFSLKNLCGWKDKFETEVTTGDKGFNISYSKDD